MENVENDVSISRIEGKDESMWREMKTYGLKTLSWEASDAPSESLEMRVFLARDEMSNKNMLLWRSVTTEKPDCVPES